MQQIALEATNATTLTTNRYAYSAQVVDIGTTNTTSTYSGTTTLLNYSGNAFGAGWTLQGLEQIIPETGGVILDLGTRRQDALVYRQLGSGGGTFTDPAGEFSTLVKNSGGTYTDTLTDGTQITFSSGGAETATIDLNNQHITYSYSGGNLTSIEDNYANFTTLSYSGGFLQTIEDPASRVTTITHSGGNLTRATLPDGSTWNYALCIGRPIDPDYGPTFAHGHHRVRFGLSRGDDLAAGQYARDIHELPGVGLDQQRHVGQPGGADLAGAGRRHVHQPQQQHDHHPARLAGPGHGGQPDRCPGRRTNVRPNSKWVGDGRRGSGQPDHLVTRIVALEI